MAGDSTAKQPDKRASPLTVSFRDTAFANFVNSDNSTQQLAPKQQIPQSTITQLRPSNPNTPQRRGTVGSTETYNSSNIQLARPTQLTTAGSAGSHAIDDDDMWLNSDFIDINSQEILDMVLAEEQMFATQQFLASNDVSVSQEFTEPRAMNAKDMQMNARDTRDASNAVTRSVPVTPSAIEPIYISDTETPGRVSADESACGSTGSVKILSLDGNSRPQPPSGSSTSHPVRLQNQSSQQDAVSRGKVNLFPRLAKHIPSSARPQFHSSSQTATNIQRPPIRPPPSAALNDASINRMQQPRLQNQQQYTTRYSQRMRPPPSLGPFNTDPGTASVSTNASVKRHSPYSSHPSPLRRSTSTNNPQTDSPHYPPPHIPHPSQPPSSSNGMAAELERLRAENTRIKSEAEQLKLQLYTKEGEVKIVRENLAKTEIDNTHLQEQLSNQIATANATQKSSEARLRADIERLQTELLFYQQEAQAAAIVKTPRSNNHTPSTQRRLTRMDGGTQEVAVHVATQSKNANGMAVDPPVSASKPYPTMDDFVSTPSTAVAKHQTPSSGKTAGSVSKHGMTQPARDNKDALEMAAKKENLALLGILEEIARQPINKAFGSLMDCLRLEQHGYM
ncbi:hypothetical protein GGI07_001438 [Coemansia sp. Benny D115]|nr:hypothetical protein GGI07_001438 [Coemansia sp. Benny D115]